ncbi:MAG: 50S ribosomal protein L29 [Candidatus Saccharimonadaceae bacterium]
MADVTKKTAKPTTKKAVKAIEVKTLAQLEEDLLKLQNDYRESRRSHQMGELVNPRVLTVQRKSIARSQTAIRQAEIAAAMEEN